MEKVKRCINSSIQKS